MFCPNCGNNIEDNLVNCPVCGSPTALQPQQPVQNQNNQTVYQQQPVQNQYNQYGQPNQPIMQQPYQYQQNQYAGMPGFSPNYPAISEFVDQAKSLRNYGIAAAILMFGIGFIFSIVIFVKSRKLKVPELVYPTPDELAQLEDGKKKLKTAKILAILPIVGWVLSFIVGFINGLSATL